MGEGESCLRMRDTGTRVKGELSEGVGGCLTDTTGRGEKFRASRR